jgi:protein required for attachment to host cells
MTGQGMTWVLVADAHRARIFAVEDAGLPPRLRHTIQATSDGAAKDAEGDLPESGKLSTKASVKHGALHSTGKPEDQARHRFARELVHMLEHAQGEDTFHHLVLVAPPTFLGMLREGLPRGLAGRVRATETKDYQHVPDHELAERIRPLVQIWPTPKS